MTIRDRILAETVATVFVALLVVHVTFKGTEAFLVGVNLLNTAGQADTTLSLISAGINTGLTAGGIATIGVPLAAAAGIAAAPVLGPVLGPLAAPVLLPGVALAGALGLTGPGGRPRRRRLRGRGRGGGFPVSVRGKRHAIDLQNLQSDQVEYLQSLPEEVQDCVTSSLCLAGAQQLGAVFANNPEATAALIANASNPNSLTSTDKVNVTDISLDSASLELACREVFQCSLTQEEVQKSLLNLAYERQLEAQDQVAETLFSSLSHGKA